MQIVRLSVGALTEPAPWDPADPGTPAIAGWHGQDPGSPVSEFRPETANDMAGEIIRLSITGGLAGPHRDELRQIFRNDDIQDIATLPLLDPIAGGDVVSQVGSYKRAGYWVQLRARVEWANTDAGLDAEPMRFHLPYQAAQVAVGRLSITQSNFRLDNPGGANQAYEPIILSPPSVFVEMWRGNELGAAPLPVPIGDSVADGGNRIAEFFVDYKTTGVRNTAWPYIEWYSLTHTPISPGPTVLEYRYDGALNGDAVDLFKSPDFVTPVASAVITAPPPSGRGSFTISAAGSYFVRLRGKFFSRNAFNVSAS